MRVSSLAIALCVIGLLAIAIAMWFTIIRVAKEITSFLQIIDDTLKIYNSFVEFILSLVRKVDSLNRRGALLNKIFCSNRSVARVA